LRLLDCLVTNYARDNPDVHYLRSQTLEIFDVYGQYKTQLKSFSKKQFDPFGRVHRQCSKKHILQDTEGNEEVNTTIGQMNFFKWAIQSELLGTYIFQYNTFFRNTFFTEYARTNTQKIEEYMQTPQSKRKQSIEEMEDDDANEVEVSHIKKKKGYNKRVKIHHVPRVESFP